MVKASKKPKTIRELKKENYEILPLREEMRKNLIDKVKKGEALFPGIIGYEETVIPQIQNAILSGQDMILLGERGQAKTKLIRNFINLLDEEVPAISGCAINDNPYSPICKECKEKVQECGDDVEIVWITREERYGEKLATPDVTTPDLIGEIDPIKLAEGRYLSDELVIHYGLIPRTNRGIFCINELPDLAEKIQVGLFNIMEERDIQIRGFKVRLPLDIYIVSTANPEDYTNRGRIITPLRDRYGCEIRTHYPREVEEEIVIVDQERRRFKDESIRITVPDFMKEIVAETTRIARTHPDINQRSGVSVRMSIANFENLISNSVRRCINLNEKDAVPRITDLPHMLPSMVGKIELEGLEETDCNKVARDLIKKAVKKVFDRYYMTDEFDDFLMNITSDVKVSVSDEMPLKEYSKIANLMGTSKEKMKRVPTIKGPAMQASHIEFILEGLHLHKKLNKDEVDGKAVYRSSR
ncbi:MAG: magnesium chelatase [Thermodesulfobacteriota bacterium]|nr:magnesium chelatase [Thermodesulfobacteriota bacterium]